MESRDGKMKKSLFSVVIPAYNREKTIKRTIESVLAQKYTNFEVIVVDDGSVDGTARIINEYVQENKVRYVFQENGGAQKARNTGLHLAKGEYILFLDSDDWLLPNSLGHIVKKFKEDDAYGAVYGLTGLIVHGRVKVARKDYLEGNIYKEVLEQGYLTSTSFIAMRREIFSSIGEWDLELKSSQDDDMCFRIAKCYKIGLINRIIGIYGTDAGKGKQIGSSPLRVADGWKKLWDKYEVDTVTLCGKEVYIKHISENALRYAAIDDRQKVAWSMQKIREYGASKQDMRLLFCRLILARTTGRIKRFIK